jgi:hypothetical protein
VRDHAFCRRHAGVVRALPVGTPLTGTLPPINNRALPLLRWTGETLDPLMRRVLQHHRPDGTLLVDPVRLVSTRGQHSWRRSWAVADAAGQTAIDLDVAEEADALLIARVDGQIVAQSVPPWVTDRTSDPDRDLFLRRAFYERVVMAVDAAVKASAAVPTLLAAGVGQHSPR